MKKILIICTSNKTRSPMAMEIANMTAQKLDAPYLFRSAGLAAVGSAADENVCTVLKEKGIDTSHIPIHISQYNIEEFDSVHVMSERQKITLCSYFKNKLTDEKIVVLGIEDPYYKGIEAYRSARDRLEEYYTDYIKENK